MLKRSQKDTCTILDYKLSDIQGGKVREGFLFGVELELEGRNVQMEGVASKNWRRVEEGSLRGESCEYVFSAPCALNEAKKRVNKLFETFAENGVALKDSYRTSTHVHMNFSDKSVRSIVTFFLFHTVLEQLFEYYCGETRKGNLFCLSCRDNEGLIDLMDQSLFQYSNFREFNDNVRYNAANLAALGKFGSIEIRTMRGANSAEMVNDWLDILNQLYIFSCRPDCPPPHKMCENLSHLGAVGFLRQVFDEGTIAKLMATWPPVRDFHRSLMDGVRLVQMFSYKLQRAWEAEPVAQDMFAPKKVGGHFGDGTDAIELILGMGVGRVPNLHDTPNGYELAMAGAIYTYSEKRGCWLHQDTSEPCRWVVYNGDLLQKGTIAERMANTFYNDWHDEPEDEYEPDYDDDEDHEDE